MFRLAFRQTEGLIGSIVGLLGLTPAIPDLSHYAAGRRCWRCLGHDRAPEWSSPPS